MSGPSCSGVAQTRNHGLFDSVLTHRLYMSFLAKLRPVHSSERNDKKISFGPVLRFSDSLNREHANKPSDKPAN